MTFFTLAGCSNTIPTPTIANIPEAYDVLPMANDVEAYPYQLVTVDLPEELAVPGRTLQLKTSDGNLVLFQVPPQYQVGMKLTIPCRERSHRSHRIEHDVISTDSCTSH